MAIGIGFAVIYLTQVRSILPHDRRCDGRDRRAHATTPAVHSVAGLVGVSGALIMGDASCGRRHSAAVDSEVLDLRGQGALTVYQQERGNFIAYTVGDLLDQYLSGAGLGRWGMMNRLFRRSVRVRGRADSRRDSAHRMAARWRLADVVLLRRRNHRHSSWCFGLPDDAGVQSSVVAAVCVGAATVFVVGMSFASPAFNTQLACALLVSIGALHGAEDRPSNRETIRRAMTRARNGFSAIRASRT